MNRFWLCYLKSCFAVNLVKTSCWNNRFELRCQRWLRCS